MWQTAVSWIRFGSSITITEQTIHDASGVRRRDVQPTQSWMRTTKHQKLLCPWPMRGWLGVVHAPDGCLVLGRRAQCASAACAEIALASFSSSIRWRIEGSMPQSKPVLGILCNKAGRCGFDMFAYPQADHCGQADDA